MYAIALKYEKYKLVKFIRKAHRSVRGRVCVTARATKIVKDLADISDSIFEDLVAFNKDEDATLPSERA